MPQEITNYKLTLIEFKKTNKKTLIELLHCSMWLYFTPGNLLIGSGDYAYFPPQPPGSLVISDSVGLYKENTFLWAMTSNSLTYL